jgi:hypothetical protein
MRHVRVLLPAVALVLAAAPAQARVSTPDSARVVATNAPVRADAPIPEAMRARIDGHREKARALFEAGHNAEARRELMAAASLLRESGVLPSVELITVATIALVEERPLLAAAAMDDLAANAEAFDQPDVEAQALLESATQYAAADRSDVARERIALLRTLLPSPQIPDSFRAELESRLVSSKR